MNKQTAVEYLINQLERIGFSTNNIVEFENEIQIAKAMHKEEIIDTWNDGAYGGGQFTTTHDTAEQYYIENYGGEQ